MLVMTQMNIRELPWLKIIISGAVVTTVVLLVMLIPRIERFGPIDNDWSSGASIKKIQADSLTVKGALEASDTGEVLQKNIMRLCYPVHAVMIRYDDKSPDTLPGLAGTTWTKLGTDRYLRGASKAGTTGGSLTTDLTVLSTNQLPSHVHTVGSLALASAGAHTHTTSIGEIVSGIGDSKWANQLSSTKPRSNISYSSNSAGAHTHTISGSTGSVGSGAGHSHSYVPPYVTVVIWRRTA